MSDATNRGLRTLAQGAVAAILIAVVPVIVEATAGSTAISEVDWVHVADRALYTAFVAVLMAGLAWAQKASGR